MFTANSMNCLLRGPRPRAAGKRHDSRQRIPTATLVLSEPPAEPDTGRAEHPAARHPYQRSFDNAFALDMAMGGSTNTVLHTLAVAIEAGIAFDLDRLNEVAERVPHVCKVSPAGHYHMEDVDRAGGISAILKTSARSRARCTSTASPSPARRSARTSPTPTVKDLDVIRPLDNSYSHKGGLAILFGNLAPRAAWSRPAA